MKRITIVGAGLSGLTAAINLAREGYDVEVLEREKQIGGMPVFRPDPAGSPFGLTRLSDYIGIDISPAVKFIEEGRQVIWGKKYNVLPRAAVPLYMVERGSRETSIDYFLYKIAKEEGVDVKFGHPVNIEQLFDLPPNSIIATGFDRAQYEALGIPHFVGKSFVAKGTIEHKRTSVTIYMGDYSLDYGFSCTINGICYAFIFQKNKKLTVQDLGQFEADIKLTENYTLDPWVEVNVIP